MRQLLLSTAAAIAFATPAPAAQHSSLSPVPDPQIRVVSYSPTKRIEVVGLVGQPTTFTFPAGENVYRVVQSSKLADDGSLADAGWQMPDKDKLKDTPMVNNLTLWPAVPGTTIMTVTTIVSQACRSDHVESCPQKAYAFRLVAKPDPTGMPDDPDATFNLIFKGGASSISTAPTVIADGADPPPHRPTRRERAAAAEQNQIELAADRLRTDSFNGVGGCHYHAQGKRPSAIEPRCPLDNGQWTIMRFPGLSVKPAVYVGTCDGHNERLARQHGGGDFVIIEEIAASFCLRLSPDALDIVNDAFNAVGSPTNSGTIAPGVQRQIIQATDK